MYKVITISREYGSGGRYVGNVLAEKLGIPFYDRELIALLSEKSNYSKKYIEKNEDTRTTSFLYGLATEGIYMANPYDSLTPTDKIFFAQDELIKELAEKGPCIIVGRCADYILRHRNDVLNVFISCDIKHRIERGIKYYKLEEKNAEKTLRKKDKARASTYNYYTDRIWGSPDNYDIAINTGTFSIEQAADIIVDCYNK